MFRVLKVFKGFGSLDIVFRGRGEGGMKNGRLVESFFVVI